MDRGVYWKIVEKSQEPEAAERSVSYLAEHLGKFLRKGERVLICFPEQRKGSLSNLMEQAVLRCDAVPVLWGPDRLWKTLLRQAFTNKVTAIIGPPLILLGLMKLKKHQSTPLYIRRVITAGYPCPDWMIDGIVKGLDCEMGGCFGLEHSGIVAGFACGNSWGVHLREDVYGADIVDETGNSLPEGEVGQIVLYPREEPELRLPMGDYASLTTQPCKCGSNAPRLTQMCYGGLREPDLDALAHYLMSWTSVLDCHVAKGPFGLEIEIICFQGEKLPKLPSSAKLVVRPWNPQTDKPLLHASSLKIPEMM